MRKLAPLLRRKLKKRPRGKPFPLGNTFGVQHRFKPGNRANPGGRPSFAEVGKAARAWFAAKVPGDPYERTGAEVTVEMLGTQILRGDRAAAAELIDRAEGRPAQALHVSSDTDPLTELCKLMAEEGRRAGPPILQEEGNGRNSDANGDEAQ